MSHIYSTASPNIDLVPRRLRHLPQLEPVLIPKPADSEARSLPACLKASQCDLQLCGTPVRIEEPADSPRVPAPLRSLFYRNLHSRRIALAFQAERRNLTVEHVAVLAFHPEISPGKVRSNRQGR